MADGHPRPAPGQKIIPLTPGRVAPAGERRALMRAAVLEVIGHLVLEARPPRERSLYFDQAAGLLDEAGWGLDELLDAVTPGPAQDRLFDLLGLT